MLYDSHKNILDSSTSWLDDLIIHAAQTLLKIQFPRIGSLQPPCLAQKLAMTPQTKEFVQNFLLVHWCAHAIQFRNDCPPQESGMDIFYKPGIYHRSYLPINTTAYHKNKLVNCNSRDVPSSISSALS